MIIKYLKKILGITALEDFADKQVIFSAEVVRYMTITADTFKNHKQHIITLSNKETVIIDLNDPIDEDKYN